MKKILLYLVLLSSLLAVLFGVSCSKVDSPNNLIITNESSEIIKSVAIQKLGETHVMGSKLYPNENCHFDMGEEDGCTFRVEITDSNDQVIQSSEFIANFNYNEDEIVYINISKSKEEGWSFKLKN